MTVTGAGAGLITSHKTHIKISKMTIGKVIDSGLFDPSNLGLAMAPAAADTLRQYLADFKVDLNSYDLILTGDLSKFGKEAFLKILNEYGIYLGNNYNDAGLLVYDVNNQNVNAGGSGCGCITVATFGYVYKALLEAKLNKVLIIATGALINPIAAAQNQTIPCIAHAVTLERVKK
jgi:stage V sporulation protein AD